MITGDLLALLVCVFFGIVIGLLSAISRKMSGTLVALASIDAEVFHLAQEQNPAYGACSKCGTRRLVRHVVPKDREPTDDETELFYCQPCWWMAGDVRFGDDSKRYKDRSTWRDRMAAGIGPG